MRAGKFNWRLWSGLLISFVLLYFATRKVDVNAFTDAVRRANYIYVIPAIILNLFQLWLRSLRWKVLLLPLKKIRIASLFSAIMIGAMANNMFPARFGEIVRAFVIGRKEDVKKSACLATVIVERLFDGMAIFAILACVLLFFKEPLPVWLKRSAYIALALNVSLFATLIMARTRVEAIIRFFAKIMRPLPDRIGESLLHFIEHFLHGLEVLKNTRQVAFVLIFSVLIWIPPGLAIYLILQGFGIYLPIYASFLLLVIFCLGVAVPSAPGFIGIYQFMAVIGLALFGIERSDALSFSIVYHVVNYIPATLIGLVFFFREGLTFGQMARVGKEERG